MHALRSCPSIVDVSICVRWTPQFKGPIARVSGDDPCTGLARGLSILPIHYIHRSSQRPTKASKSSTHARTDEGLIVHIDPTQNTDSKLHLWHL